MEEVDTQGSMIEKREELMVQTISTDCPTWRKAYFLKPVSNPTNQHLPNLSSHCLPLNPTHIQLIKKKVSFLGMLEPLESWESWVDDLQQSYEETWEKVGILEAIKVSTYRVSRDTELIIELAERWCSETNTFFFPWGEATITLEDVLILGGFSILGSSARSHFKITEDGEFLKKLTFTWRNIKKNNKTHATHKVWMNYFRGHGGELEHVAFVVLWLSRYVFTTISHTVISSNVFSMAISLVRGTRIALGPAVLALIYSELRLLNEKLVNSKCECQDDGSNKLVLRAPFQLVQIWAWERFPKLGLKPISLDHGQPRMARWREIRNLRSRVLRLEIESSTRDDFLWRPYVLPLKNWVAPKFYSEQGMWVLVESDQRDEYILSFAKCLRSCVLVGVDCVEQYLPQRVAKQFALDQDIPFSFPSLSVVSKEVAWNSYDKPLNGLRLYLPPRLREGGITFQYSEWWRKLFLQGDVETHGSCRKKLNTISKGELDADHEVNGKGIPSCSSYTAVCLGSFSRSRQTQNENFSSFEANGLVEDITENLQVELEEHQGYFESNCNQEECNGTFSVTERLMVSPVNTLSRTLVLEEQGDEMEDATSKQVNSSDDCLVITDDEEDTSPSAACEALALALDSRISKLERKVFKLKSKAV